MLSFHWRILSLLRSHYLCFLFFLSKSTLCACYWILHHVLKDSEDFCLSFLSRLTIFHFLKSLTFSNCVFLTVRSLMFSVQHWQKWTRIHWNLQNTFWYLLLKSLHKNGWYWLIFAIKLVWFSSGSSTQNGIYISPGNGFHLQLIL